MKALLFAYIVLIFSPAIVAAQSEDSVKQVSITHGSKGFEFRTSDNKYLFQIQSRFQFRYSTPTDQNPITLNDFDSDSKHAFRINRVRLKIGGHAFRPWLKYYWEYELQQSNLLDFRIMIEKWEALNIKVGQWKVEFSRERRISSGGQQLMDRSIINRPFTVDRQQGIELYGHLTSGGVADFNYWLAVLTGTGRGNQENDDKHLMYFGRVQWNFLGEVLGFEGSDLDDHQKPSALLALAAVTNRSPYTRFSTSGGGSLQGYEDPEPGQYRVNQLNIETAFKYSGFSWQSELHYKKIFDRINNTQPDQLRGYYVQAGYFFHETFAWWPEPLELAARHSSYHPQQTEGINSGSETSVALNYFFVGHKNKLTMEISYFDYGTMEENLTDSWRYRIQWDISL